MNKFRLTWIVSGVLFILAVVAFYGPFATGAAEKCSIVTIRGRGGIEPGTLTVNKGDCVVWMNWTRNDEVILKFKEGEKCLRATRAPVGFKMDVPSGCYIAGALNYGETASLIFSEPGTYNYEIEFKVGGKISGTIIVKS